MKEQVRDQIGVILDAQQEGQQPFPQIAHQPKGSPAPLEIKLAKHPDHLNKLGRQFGINNMAISSKKIAMLIYMCSNLHIIGK